MRGVANYYYYALYKINKPEDNTLFTKYFRSSDEIAEYLDVSRATIFNLIKGQRESKIHKKYIIEKLQIPIKRFKTVKVDDEEIS